MHIKNTRRVLCVGPPGCNALWIVKDLTGSQPTAQEDGSIAGVSHELQIKTRYYTADVPIWLDEIADHKVWAEEFTQPEAREVVQAIATYIVCFTDDETEDCLERFQLLLEAINKVVSSHDDEHVGAEYVAVVTSIDQRTPLSDKRLDTFTEQAECHNFELVDHFATGKNEFMEKQGIERVKEILEAVDWAMPVSGDEDVPQLDDLDFEDPDAHADVDGLTKSLLDAGDVLPPEQQSDEALAADDLEAMLGKLLAVKEQAADLPLEQRKRLAAQAVRDVMQQSDR